MVFLSHVAGKYALADTGTLGVPIFFLLSSFLITELLQREKRSTGTVHIASFYIRRILRIWPLYFAALLFGFLFVLPVASRYHLSVRELLYYLFFMGNWWTAFHGYLPGGLGPLWSITVEEQFYLFWPLMVRRMGRRGILTLSMAMWIMSQIAIVGIYHLTKPPFILVWTNTLDNLQYFALGAGLSAFLNGRIPSFRPATRFALGLASLGIFAACGPLLFEHAPVSGIRAMLGLSLAGLGATFSPLVVLLGCSRRACVFPAEFLSSYRTAAA
jgi:peptidoglycan/LPS O-acetylase OafA/YrhL